MEMTAGQLIKDLTVLGILLFWPLIPLFWIPVHLFTRLFRRLGRFTYIAAFALWSACALAVISFRKALLAASIHVWPLLAAAGWVIFALGLLLHVWTIWLLRGRIIGTGELGLEIAKLETRGAFSLCRHPTYLAHMMIFWGAAAATGSAAVTAVAAADLLLTLLLIVPLEEKELRERFGSQYEDYCSKVPPLMPRPFRGKKLLKFFSCLH